MTPLLITNSFNNYWHRSPWKSKKGHKGLDVFESRRETYRLQTHCFSYDHTNNNIWNLSIDWDFFTEFLIKPRPPSYTWHTVAPDCRGVAWWTWRKRGQGRSHARPAGQRLSDIGSVAQHTQLSLANYGQGFTLHWNPGPRSWSSPVNGQVPRFHISPRSHVWAQRSYRFAWCRFLTFGRENRPEISWRVDLSKFRVETKCTASRSPDDHLITESRNYT